MVLLNNEHEFRWSLLASKMWMTEHLSHFKFCNKTQVSGPILWCLCSGEGGSSGLSVIRKKSCSENLLGRGLNVHNRTSFTNFCGCMAQSLTLCMASSFLLNRCALFLFEVQLTASGWTLAAARFTSLIFYRNNFFLIFFFSPLFPFFAL